MADKYSNLRGDGGAEYRKWRKCFSKKKFETKERAFIKGQTVYKCDHCNGWHRSTSIGKLIDEIRRAKKLQRESAHRNKGK